MPACRDQSPPVPVFSVQIIAPRTSLLHGPGGGQSVQLEATARSADGSALEGRRIEWTTQPAGVVTVASDGLVTAVGVGSVVVRASAEGKSASVILAVQPVPVVSIDITSAPLALVRTPLAVAGQQLTAVAYDSTGTALPNRQLGWLSRNEQVAAVSALGVVTAVNAGITYIVASGDAGRDSLLVSVTVDNTLPTGFDVAVTSALWTQASQTGDNTIAMLTGGRDAVVNVMTAAPSALAAASVMELRLTTAEGTLRWSARRSVYIPAGASTAANPTVQFLVPSAELAPGLQWEVLWDPDGDFTDADASSDRYPRIGRAGLAVVQPPTLKLRFVPITLTGHNGTTGVVNEGNAEEYLRMIRQMGPVGPIEYSIAPAFAISTSFGAPPNGAGSAFWVSLLQQLDLARVSSPDFADAHWVGVVQPPTGFTFATFGGFGYIPSNGASFGPGTRTFGLIHLNWFFRESQTRELMMHELGHNLGRSHAPCGGATGTDPSFPDPSGRVGSGGHDTYSFQRSVAERAFAISSEHGDTMGYCTPVWISTYSYDAMLRFRGSATLAAQAVEPPQRAVVVHGLAADDGSATVSSAALVEGLRALPADAGEWEAALVDADGAVIARRRFALGVMDHLDALRPISVAIPVTAEFTAQGKRIEVRSPNGRTSTLQLPER